MRWYLLGLAFLGQAPLNVGWTPLAVGQMRFLYAHMRTEFVGCLYGKIHGDTIAVQFFVESSTDPRQASDSQVPQGVCPNIVTTEGNHFIGVAHSHIRAGSLCVPSARDEHVLDLWAHNGAEFGAIMCAHGDSIALFSPHAFGVFAIPPLDSLYHFGPR